MDALFALQNRASCARLTDPAPTETQRQALFQAASRAADHKHLQPWRFLTIEGEARARFGKLLCIANNIAPNAPAAKNTTQKAFRAPLIIVAICRFKPCNGVPEWEQQAATAAAVQNILTSAFAQGIGAYWRTGKAAEHPEVHSALGLNENEKLMGFIYLGTPVIPPRTISPVDTKNFVSSWDSEN